MPKNSDESQLLDIIIEQPEERSSAHYLGHRDRLRKKVLTFGPDTLQDYELLEFLLTFAIPRKDVKPLAKELIEIFGSFADVMDASPEELKARLQDVVLEKRPELKSGAKSLVTRRPRRKEELPPSKYDFPILYPVDEDEKKPEKTSAMQEVAKVAGQMTDCVKKVFQKVIPRSRVRVKRQRQKQRS